MGLWKEYFHWSVLLRWDVLSWIIAALLAVGGLVLIFDQYAAANVCFMLTTIFIFAKIAQLAVESHSSTVDRLLFTFILFGIFGIGIVETVRGVNRWAESKREPKGQSDATLNLPTPKEEAPKTPHEGLEAPPSTRPSNERNLPSSKAKTRNLGPESPPEVPPKQVETSKERQDFLVSLTKLYIASHDGISSEMMAGLQLPPDDWLNQELAKRGKAWHVERGQIVDNITKADHPTLPPPQTPAVPPPPLHVSESAEAPKPVRRFIFTQEQTNSTHDDAPFAVRIVIQTTATVQPTSLAIICDSEVAYADSRLGGGANPQRAGDGMVNNDKHIYWIFWGEPPFRPEAPLVLTLMSKTAIHALAVKEGPAYPF
jgi:hypothetical protein